MRHTLSVLVENQPGVLARVSGLFSRRGFNIESLAVSITQDPTVSRMTIVVEGSEQSLDQVEKQLTKLIEVIKVYDYTSSPVVEPVNSEAPRSLGVVSRYDRSDASGCIRLQDDSELSFQRHDVGSEDRHRFRPGVRVSFLRGQNERGAFVALEVKIDWWR